jgi:predicted TIM-barrel fold metal-dependent hydrolase
VAGVSLEAFEAVARRCAALRWHIEVNVDACDEWLAQLLARQFPDRLMWGSHLSQSGGALDDLALIGGVLESLPDPAMRRAVFCDNAERFYGL